MIENHEPTQNYFLFVYGTLMKGFNNPFSQKLQQNARWVGRARFRGQLFDLGHYPGAVCISEGSTWVHGEVWELTDFEKVIVSLDRYEGVHLRKPEYVRQQIQAELETGEGTLTWVYLFCKPTHTLQDIPHGDYRKWLSELKQHL
jgi:gamma-glutamylcyclotransferase (GGCT)/AIG2-like uncharacterized protein YtfP